MNLSDYMKKHSLTDESFEKMAAPYERGDSEEGEGAVYISTLTSMPSVRSA